MSNVTFFPATEHYSQEAKRCYFFTATRKTSVTIAKPGMNDREVYGDVICHVSAPELVEGGYILPPKVKVIEMDKVDRKSIILTLRATTFSPRLMILTSKKFWSVPKLPNN